MINKYDTCNVMLLDKKCRYNLSTSFKLILKNSYNLNQISQ